MKRIDNDHSENFWKIAITGNGGTGKTTIGVSAPNPLIVLSERQGMPSIRQAAARLGKPVPPVVLVERADDYRAVLRALQGPRDKPFELNAKGAGGKVENILRLNTWPETVVIDSLSDACDVLVTEIREQSPQRKGKDGLPVDAQRFWGVLVDRSTQLIKSFRNLPMHVVFLCLLNDRTQESSDGKTQQRILVPKLATNSMPQVLCAAVNVMGYTYRTFEDREPERPGGPPQRVPVFGVATMGPEGMLTKPCAPLRRFEVADLTNWIGRLSGSLEFAPEAPIDPENAPEGGELEAPTGEESASDDSEPEGESEPETLEFSCVEGCGAEVDREGDVCPKCEAKAFDSAEPAEDPFKLEQPGSGVRKRGGKRGAAA